MHGHYILTQNGCFIARLRGETQVPGADPSTAEERRHWQLYLQCDTAAWAHDGATFQIIGPSRRPVSGMAVSHDNGVLFLVGSGPPP